MGVGLSGELIISAFGIGITTLIATLGYFAKKKLESIESDIENVHQKVESRKEMTEKEHRVVVGWLSRMTDALRKNGMQVERPDEVSEEINIEEEE